MSMGWIAAGSAVAGLAGAYMSSNAAEDAASQQANSAQQGIDSQNAMFQQTQALLKPFVDSGQNAITQQGNMLGINGAGAQQASIDSIQNSPMFKSLAQQGQNGILQNASATGGLRGGNTQAALAKFNPQLLQALLQQQFQNLGSITSQGQASAAGQASIGANTANSIGTLYGQQGQAFAGGALGQASAYGQVPAALAQSAGLYLGARPLAPQPTGAAAWTGMQPAGGGFGDYNGLGTDPFSGLNGGY